MKQAGDRRAAAGSEASDGCTAPARREIVTERPIDGSAKSEKLSAVMLLSRQSSLALPREGSAERTPNMRGTRQCSRSQNVGLNLSVILTDPVETAPIAPR